MNIHGHPYRPPSPGYTPPVPPRHPERPLSGNLDTLFPPLRLGPAAMPPAEHGPFAFELPRAAAAQRVRDTVARPHFLAWLAVLFAGANLAVSASVLYYLRRGG